MASQRDARAAGPGRALATVGLAAIAVTTAVSASAACSPAVEPPLADVTAADRQCLAQALYWEARAEGREGMQAVGWVVLNRIADDRFPATACDVVQQGGEQPGCQFSYWCDGRSDLPRAAAPWALAQDVAAELLSAPPRDPTHGALFYHAADLLEVPWAIAREQTARIGNHIYYR